MALRFQWEKLGLLLWSASFREQPLLPITCQFTLPAPSPSHPGFPAPPQDQSHSVELFSKPHSSAAFCFCASLFLLYFVQFLSVNTNRVFFFLFLLSGGSFPTGIMTPSCPQCSSLQSSSPSRDLWPSDLASCSCPFL